MPSAAYMGMMMMLVMVVSLSKHAKQPLSLLLLPKVFVHLSFTSYPVPDSSERRLPCTSVRSHEYLFFLIHLFSSFILISPVLYFVMVLKFISDVLHVVMCCVICENVSWCLSF